MAKTKTMLWDAAEYLNSEKEMAAYLEAALEEGDASLYSLLAWRHCSSARDDAIGTRDRSWPRESL